MPSERIKPNLIYWATVEHHRWWMASDGVMRRAIQQYGLRGVTVRDIARTYSVGRGILAGSEQQLASLIQHQAAQWPADLVMKAKFCAALAEEAASQRLTRGRLASAMTKLMWFMKPDGWTMYDSFAACGLLMRPGINSVARMINFYDELANREFDHVQQQAQNIINGSSLPSLSGARVIDKLLMFKGFGDDRLNKAVEDCELYLGLLGDAERNHLSNLASSIQSALGPKPMGLDAE